MKNRRFVQHSKVSNAYVALQRVLLIFPTSLTLTPFLPLILTLATSLQEAKACIST